MTSTADKIKVMEAFEDGKPIRRRYLETDTWFVTTATPSWDWARFEYSLALTQPSWDWSHVSDEINFLVRQSPAFGGNGLGLATRPAKKSDRWRVSVGYMTSTKPFASYDPGTCDWQDSLVVRPGYVEGGQ